MASETNENTALGEKKIVGAEGYSYWFIPPYRNPDFTESLSSSFRMPGITSTFSEKRKERGKKVLISIKTAGLGLETQSQSPLTLTVTTTPPPVPDYTHYTGLQMAQRTGRDAGCNGGRVWELSCGLPVKTKGRLYPSLFRNMTAADTSYLVLHARILYVQYA